MLRIVQANAVYDPASRTAHALLDTYHTLTEWSAAVRAAGAAVTVVQRFHATGEIERDGIAYRLIKDSQQPWLSTKAAPAEFVAAIAGQRADVVHINGLIFPELVAAVRRACGPSTVIVVQHHGGEFPIRGSGLVGIWQRRHWRNGLAGADALSFTAREQAEAWRTAGVLSAQKILEIVEAGTTLRRVDRARARAAIGIDATPLILWVGRLTTNKDPLTVLDGLERVLPALPTARVVMVFGDDTLIDAVDQRVRASETLRDRVVLAGRVARDELPNYYSAADVFVSGSHFEGSGYALIEAMSAGLIPVVTDIPSFRVIAGTSGARWPAGDAAAFAAALQRVCSASLDDQRTRVADQYDRVLRWDAIAARTVAEYRALAAAKAAAR
ncbi:MAG TPA: glycosyltransferase family 4 protein [Vicinamibacterales bacterium]|nr:glycosyltransferase family 4 protein [Vicinamibacterales bacterium]